MLEFQKLTLSTKKGLLAFLLFELIIGLEALLAYHDQLLTTSQLLLRYGSVGDSSSAFLVHPAFWADALLFPPLAGWMVYKSWQTFSGKWLALGLFWGLVASGMLHYAYVKSLTQTFISINGRLTAAGWIHAAYVVAATIIVFIFYTEPSVRAPELIKGLCGLFIFLLISMFEPAIKSGHSLLSPVIFTELGVIILAYVISWTFRKIRLSERLSD